MRIWKTSDSDLELDKIKEEIMSQLSYHKANSGKFVIAIPGLEVL